MAGEFFWQTPYRHLLWRAKPWTNHAGTPMIDLWPWYRDAEGEWRACNARYGGGLKFPFDSARELRDALCTLLPPDE